ncbi:hypothetical protein RFI_36723, partial [Reticulomyxa filosa]
MNITKENCIRDANVRDWSVGGIIYYKLPVFFEGNAMTLFTNNWSMMNMNERPYDNVNVVWTNKKTNGFVFVGRMNTRGGMQMQINKTDNESNDNQQSNINNQYAKEIELLMIFFGDITNKYELQSKLEEFKGDMLRLREYLALKRNSNQVKPITNSNIIFCHYLKQKNECHNTHNKKNKEINESKEEIKEKNESEQDTIKREEVLALQKVDTFGVIDNLNNQSKIHQTEIQDLILENATKDQ